MQNDLTTVEPPIRVTAVPISDDNCFQSPFFSDLLVGFFPFGQKFWKFRLRNKWNASFRVENFWSKHRLPKLCGSSLDFEFIRECMKIYKVRSWTTCGQSGPLSTDGLLWSVSLIRSKLAVPCQKILVSISTLPSSNQTFSQNRMDHFDLFGNFGRFPFNQKVWFSFSATPSRELHSIFQNF